MKLSKSQIQNLITKLITFLTADIWRLRLSHFSKTRAFFLQMLRIMVLAIRGFKEDKCGLRASALTFYSLLAIVPIVAMFFGIARGFGLDQLLEKQLIVQFPEHQLIIAQIISFSHSMLDNIGGGIVAGIGVIILFWTIIRVLGTIETSFNDIWKVKESRNLFRKISDYLAIMFVGPINLIISSGLTIFISANVTYFIQQIDLLGALAPLVYIVLAILPYCLIWLLFAFIYIVMPNTKVHFKSGLVAAIIAGTIYQVTQWLYVYFQVGVVNYNTVYGSFAALPLFLVWLQLSWLIVLFGAEISYAVQNVESYEFEKEAANISPANKRLLSLLIAHLIVKTFAKGQQPMTSAQIADVSEVPARLVREILANLMAAGLLSKIESADIKEPTYQPSSDINRFSISYVIEALDKRGFDNIPVAPTDELKALVSAIHTFNLAIQQSPANKLLKEI
jgi:membrane protein